MSIDRKLTHRREDDDATNRPGTTPLNEVVSPEVGDGGVDGRRDALLDTIVALRLGPEADEKTRAREREQIVESQRRITDNVLQRVRAMAKQRDTRRHG